jgi:hypothetical protein
MGMALTYARRYALVGIAVRTIWMRPIFVMDLARQHHQLRTASGAAAKARQWTGSPDRHGRRPTTPLVPELDRPWEYYIGR